MNKHDFRIENHGSLYLVRPLTKPATRWLEDVTDAQWFGGAAVVEPRYLAPLVEGMWDAGFATEAL